MSTVLQFFKIDVPTRRDAEHHYRLTIRNQYKTLNITKYCSEEGTVVVVIDSGEEKVEFILSFSATKKLAKPLMVAKLIAQGEVDIEYQRVPCKYATSAHLMVKVHESSKFPNYLTIALSNKGGLNDITAI
ncbi:putative Major pollen allergen Ory s 1 precursor [Capsicum annuum]|uniref:Expansin-like EG45 domain-containing protein n=1 Tax=Capsicum annuum TaxID=4072 RepID=A0A2G3A4U2_CAPAN|nr:putative Major pollen allergen Ory s 1 precursor [Capsicum annuum]KAF3682514.1 putative Major pollen allergen Ory s 1 precursor [Capsicum annuum]PHT89269.1 hypothetical protein T459_04382 [Capsicum annuum]